MKQEIKTGNIYTGIGNSGITKDIGVTGVLIEYNYQHDHAILKEGNRVYSVTCNSLVLVGLHTGNISRWENDSSIDYKKYLNDIDNFFE